MARTLEFFFDFISPFSYVAWHALPHHLDTAESDIAYRPAFLGAVMQTTGNRPPATVPAKGAYMTRDIERCCQRYGIAYRMNPNFPMMNTRPVLRAACGLADAPAEQVRFIDTIFHHVWAASEPLKTDDLEQVAAVCEAAGLDGARMVALSENEDAKARMKANTDEAISRGAFGMPSFFVGEDLFFGHDRLDYAIEAMRA
ncbi:2-hydroxychromene-2-carboxylate isomerase [Henriciella sp.]|uniref:2-hydroxychromene-2-carboxylate isomerase n=1 Tax=Henriciella sp. TaxID=1968823 RepID=UPI00261D6EB9|nr:2-hydroxychromene-2-carboxylate isomerase [Henriciella sp.]